MTENEAIKIIREYRGLFPSACGENEALDVAIKALEEIQQYRAIGTLEECLRNKDFLNFLADKMNPNDFETYLSLYNSQDKKAGGADAQANS